MRSKECARIGRMTKAEMQGVSGFKLVYVHAHMSYEEDLQGTIKRKKGEHRITYETEKAAEK